MKVSRGGEPPQGDDSFPGLKERLLEELLRRSREGLPAPSLRELRMELGLDSNQEVKTILDELADDGHIHVVQRSTTPPPEQSAPDPQPGADSASIHSIWSTSFEARHLEVCQLVAPEAIGETDNSEPRVVDRLYYVSMLFEVLRDALSNFDLATDEELAELREVDERIYWHARLGTVDAGDILRQVYKHFTDVLRRFKQKILDEDSATREMFAMVAPSPGRPGLPTKRPPGRPALDAERELTARADWQEVIAKSIQDNEVVSILQADGPAKAAQLILTKLTGMSSSALAAEVSRTRRKPK